MGEFSPVAKHNQLSSIKESVKAPLKDYQLLEGRIRILILNFLDSLIFSAIVYKSVA